MKSGLYPLSRGAVASTASAMPRRDSISVTISNQPSAPVLPKDVKSIPAYPQVPLATYQPIQVYQPLDELKQSLSPSCQSMANAAQPNSRGDEWQKPVKEANEQMKRVLEELEQAEIALKEAHELDTQYKNGNKDHKEIEETKDSEHYAHAVLLKRVGEERERTYQEMLANLALDKKILKSKIQKNEDLLSAKTKILRDMQQKQELKNSQWRAVFIRNLWAWKTKCDDEHWYQTAKHRVDTEKRKEAKKEFDRKTELMPKALKEFNEIQPILNSATHREMLPPSKLRKVVDEISQEISKVLSGKISDETRQKLINLQKVGRALTAEIIANQFNSDYKDIVKTEKHDDGKYYPEEVFTHKWDYILETMSRLPEGDKKNAKSDTIYIDFNSRKYIVRDLKGIVREGEVDRNIDLSIFDEKLKEKILKVTSKAGHTRAFAPPVSPLPLPKIQFPNFSEQKTEDLIAFADKTNDPLQQDWVKQYRDEIKLYETELNKIQFLQEKEIEQFLDKDRFGLVVKSDLQPLVQAYETAKGELRQESLNAYKDIDEKATKLGEQMIAVYGLLNNAKKAFEECKDDNRIRLFDELKELSEAQGFSVKDLCKQAVNLEECYHKANKYFGLNNKEKNTLLKGVDIKAGKLKKVFDEIGDNHHGLIKKYKREINQARTKLAQKKLLMLWRGAIEKNVIFWQNQVDEWFGSRYKIGNIPVPHGISQLLSKLRTNESEEQILLNALEVVAEKATPSFGFFAKRQLATSHAFYCLFSRSLTPENIKTLTEKQVSTIEQALKKIIDKRGKGLHLDHVSSGLEQSNNTNTSAIEIEGATQEGCSAPPSSRDRVDTEEGKIELHLFSQPRALPMSLPSAPPHAAGEGEGEMKPVSYNNDILNSRYNI